MPKTRSGKVRCPVEGCDAEFDTEMELRGHRMSHVEKDTTLVPCPVCGKQARGKAGLATHIRIEHPAGTFREGGFTCAVCGQHFKLQGRLTWHRREKHGLGRQEV